MNEEKLVQSLKSLRRGLYDVGNSVGKIDANSVRYLLSMYMGHRNPCQEDNRGGHSTC